MRGAEAVLPRTPATPEAEPQRGAHRRLPDKAPPTPQAPTLQGCGGAEVCRLTGATLSVVVCCGSPVSKHRDRQTLTLPLIAYNQLNLVVLFRH